MNVYTENSGKTGSKLKNMAIIAMLGALSAVFMLFEVHVPFSPTFVKFDCSDLPVMLGGFLLGPFAGSVIAGLKILLNILLNGTTTMFVGELSNLMLSMAFVSGASFIYRRRKTREGALLGLAVGVVVTSMLAILSNFLFIFPMYAALFNIPVQDIVQMGMVTNPFVEDVASLLLYSLLPFNLFKYTVVSFMTMLSYKKLSYLFKNR